MHVIEELVLFYNYIYSGDYLALVTLAVKPYFNKYLRCKSKSKNKSMREFVKLFSNFAKDSKDSNKNIVYNNCCNMNHSKECNCNNRNISMNNNVIPLDNLKSNSIPNNFIIKSNFDSLHDLLDLDKFKNDANSNLSVDNQIFDLVNNIDSNILIIMSALHILNNDMNKLSIKNIESELFDYLVSLDIKPVKIKQLMISSKQAIQNNIQSPVLINSDKRQQVLEYIELIKKISVEFSIPDSMIDSLKSNLLQISSVESPELKRNIDKLQKELILNIKNQINTKTKEVYSQKKLSYKTKNRSPSDIKGSVKSEILFTIRQLKEISITNLNNKSANQLLIISKQVPLLNNLLNNLYDEKLIVILSNVKYMNYAQKSMMYVNTLREKLINFFVLNYQLDSIGELTEIVKNIEDKYDSNSDSESVSSEITNSKVIDYNRLNVIDSASGMYGKINNILYNECSLMSKQLNIERLILNQDINYFEEVLKDSINVKSIVLHDVYSKFNHDLNIIIQPYIKNNYNLLLSSLNEVNSQVILFILYVGNKTVINLCYSQIINILSNT